MILATASAPASYQSPNFNLTREGYKQLVFHTLLKESVFPKCKFITRDEELHHAGSIARVVMKEFGLKDCTDPAAIRWWAKTKGLVCNRLTAHRNNRMSTMGYCYSDDGSENLVISNSEIAVQNQPKQNNVQPKPTGHPMMGIIACR